MFGDVWNVAHVLPTMRYANRVRWNADPYIGSLTPIYGIQLAVSSRSNIFYTFNKKDSYPCIFPRQVRCETIF